MLVREERGGMVVGKTWICKRPTTTTTTSTTLAVQHWNRPFDDEKNSICQTSHTYPTDLLGPCFLGIEIRVWMATTGDWPLCWPSPVIVQSRSTISPAGPGFIKNYLHYPTLRRSWKDHKILQSICLTMVGNIMKHQDAKVEISYQTKCKKKNIVGVLRGTELTQRGVKSAFLARPTAAFVSI